MDGEIGTLGYEAVGQLCQECFLHCYGREGLIPSVLVVVSLELSQ